MSYRDDDEPEGARIYFDLAVLQGNFIVVQVLILFLIPHALDITKSTDNQTGGSVHIVRQRHHGI